MTIQGNQSDRFLAFAFCWADVVIELQGGRITFASGACGPLLGRPANALTGATLETIVAPGDRVLLSQFCEVIQSYGRAADLTIRIQGSGGALVRVDIAGHSLGSGGNRRLYLALRARTRSTIAAAGDGRREGETNLYDPRSFPELAAAKLKALSAEGRRADLALVSVPEMEEVCRGIDADSR
ncbi:MAG: PAS domain-containing protein, partial [Rhodospirillales bacterium]|nr:PAS domain-containing protein [Rhodospirillales bacterium]